MTKKLKFSAGMVNDNKPYVLQKAGKSYSNVVSENNFWIELIGFNPFAGQYYNGEKDNPAFSFVVKMVDLPCRSSLVNLKKIMINELHNGKMLQFGFPHPDGFNHSALITHYYPKYDSFRVINAQLLTNDGVVEYVTFETLTKAAYKDNKVNTTLAKYIAKNTKVIITDKEFKYLKKPVQSNYFLSPNILMTKEYDLATEMLLINARFFKNKNAIAKLKSLNENDLPF